MWRSDSAEMQVNSWVSIALDLTHSQAMQPLQLILNLFDS